VRSEIHAPSVGSSPTHSSTRVAFTPTISPTDRPQKACHLPPSIIQECTDRYPPVALRRQHRSPQLWDIIFSFLFLLASNESYAQYKYTLFSRIQAFLRGSSRSDSSAAAVQPLLAHKQLTSLDLLPALAQYITDSTLSCPTRYTVFFSAS
jgi:hypothetical protein